MLLSTRTALLLALLLSTRASVADDKAVACIAAAEGGQELRTAGKLREAHEKFVACAKATCPDAIRKDCARFLGEVEASQPSIVVTAKGPDGADLFDARTSVDGEVVSAKVDGKALVLDPGHHAIRVDASDGTHAEVEVVLVEGEKNRKVVVAFPRKTPVTPPPSPVVADDRSLAAPITVMALGAVVLGGSLYLGFSARGEIADLRSACAPHCDVDALDRSKRKLVLADVGLGLGVGAMAIATYMFVSLPSRPNTTVGARVVPSGGLFTFQAVF